MARVTVEDCLDNVENRFELVLLATRRARQLAHGQPAKLDWENDKVTVVALREIAANLITPTTMRAYDEAAARAAKEASMPQLRIEDDTI